MFKDIKGFEGRYLVNAQGEIYSCPKKQSEGKGFLHNGKKLKPYKNKHGYLMVVLYGEKKHRLTIHRIVCQTFVENVENKKYVNHKNGIKEDNRAENLEWVTASENMKHAFDAKLHIPYKRKVGTESKRAKLNQKQVREIRNSDLSSRKLGKIYDVCSSVICNVKNGKSYSNVK